MLRRTAGSAWSHLTFSCKNQSLFFISQSAAAGAWTVDDDPIAWLPPTIPNPTASYRSARLPQTNGGYELPSWAETISRNGLLMENGEEYTLSGSRLTPINGAWLDGDFIVARGRER